MRANGLPYTLSPRSGWPLTTSCVMNTLGEREMGRDVLASLPRKVVCVNNGIGSLGATTDEVESEEFYIPHLMVAHSMDVEGCD